MSLPENLLNNLFNKFIAFFALTAIMLLGVLAIHSIKVDTLPLDRALGLIERTAAPVFTLKAKAQQSVFVTNCGGQCANNQTIALIQAQRQTISSTIGGTIAIINATVASIMRILQMVKKVFNFFINLVQQFSGGDKSLFFILASVRQMSSNDNPFNDIYREINTEFENVSQNVSDISTNVDVIEKGISNIQRLENIKSAGKSAKLADKVWQNCMAATLAKEQGNAPAVVDVDKLCDLAINSATAVWGVLSQNSASSGAANDIFGVGSDPSVFATDTDTFTSQGTDPSVFSTDPAVSGDTTASTTSTGIDAASSLNFLFSTKGDPNVGWLGNIDAASKMTTDLETARKLAGEKEKQALSAQAWSPQCGLYVGPTTKLDAKIAQFARSPGNTGLFSNIGDVSGGLDTSVFSADSNTPVSFGFADNTKIDSYDVKALTPEQCSYAQDAADTAQNAINQANTTTTPVETAGGVAAVTNALNSALALIKTAQDIYSTITNLTTSLMNVAQGFTSEFSSFFAGFGDVFAQAGVSNSSGVLGALENQVGSIPTLGLNNTAPIDDKGTIIDDSAFTTDQEKIAKYSDQSGDCILDAVKIKATGSAAEYKGADANLDTAKLPVVGVNNAQTYTNGSNVPDSVMGATVTDQNTPAISGLSYKTSDGTTGTVPNTPSRSLIAAGGSTNSINSTYHVCQASPWGDDNSAETGGKRLAVYSFDAKYGGPSAYRDGVSNDWRVVNNQMNKDVPEQCLLSNNDLSDADKQSIISQLGIPYDTLNTDQEWQNAKVQLDEAQRQGKVRWDTDPDLLYQNRVRGGLIIGVGDKKKEIQIKPGKCEVSYTKDEVNNALKTRGWNFNTPEIKSFAALVN